MPRFSNLLNLFEQFGMSDEPHACIVKNRVYNMISLRGFSKGVGNKLDIVSDKTIYIFTC